MIHYCPQCADLDQLVEAETHRCEKCKDTYCVHFMKDVRASVVKYGPDKKMLPFDGETRGESICWVCGTEKRTKLNVLPPVEEGHDNPVQVS